MKSKNLRIPDDQIKLSKKKMKEDYPRASEEQFSLPSSAQDTAITQEMVMNIY